MWWWLLLTGCGLFDSEEELRKGPEPVAEGPVAVDAGAQERARKAADRIVAAGSAVVAADCTAALVAESTVVTTELDLEAGAFGSPETAGEGTPLWAQAWALTHPGGTDGVDEIVDTPEGRAVHVLRVSKVAGCGFVWVEAAVATDR